MKSVALILVFLFSQPIFADEIFLLTSLGTFTSCKAAIQFRNDKLNKLHSKAFGNATDSNKISKLNATLNVFKSHKSIALNSLRIVKAQQRKEILTRIIKSIILSKLGDSSNLKKIFPSLSEAELKTVSYLIKRAVNVSNIAIKSGFNDTELMESFIRDELVGNAKFITGFARISPQINLIISGAKLGVEIGFSYWDGEIKFQDAENQILVFEKAINRLLQNHPEMKLRELNYIKDQIDELCG